MCNTRIHLFGKFRMTRDDRTGEGLPTRRAEELLSYLLLHRRQAHPREVLATLLWEGASPVQSKKYLRHTLWQLQAALDGHAGTQPNGRALVIDPGWVQFKEERHLWVDLLVFEEACARAQATNGAGLTDAEAECMKSAVDLYGGGLLQGWYHDWCQLERDRLQTQLFTLLDKLMDHAATHGRHDEAVGYAQQVLQRDRARELTHRVLMRLHYAAGDRTAALRQYERCVDTLQQELGVAPGRATAALYEAIRADRIGGGVPTGSAAATGPGPDLIALGQVRELLTTTQAQIAESLGAVERAMTARGPARSSAAH